MSPAKPRQPTPRQEAASAETTVERLRELAADPKLARLVAANPSTPAELLLQLCHSDDKAVRKACTSNANTPVEALLKLGAQFPEQLLENPVFDLLLLAHPGLFEELPTSTLNSLLKRDQVPVALIRWAWKHRGESTLHSLLMNPNTPADVVEELCKAKDPEVRMAAELHCARELPGWAREIQCEDDLLTQTKLKKAVHIASSQKWTGLCRQPMSPDDDEEELYRDAPLLKELIDIKSSHRWHGVVGQIIEMADSEIGIRCLALVSVELKRIAAAKINASTVLVMLAEDRDQGVREAVASNYHAPRDAIIRLANDRSQEVRCCVAKNAATPVNVVARLAQDQESSVRRNSALNINVSEDVLNALARDDNWLVRHAVAGNTRTSITALIQLGEDEDSDVREAVAGNSRAPKDLLVKLSEDPSLHIELASNSQTPTEIITRLAKNKDWRVRRSAAKNSESPVEILKQLSGDEHQSVRSAVAANSKTPVQTLDSLANDNNEAVLISAASNKETSTRTLIRLALDEDNSLTYVRNAVALNTNAPVHLLKSFTKDRDPGLRLAVAKNASISSGLFEELAGDEDIDVRRALIENCQVPTHLKDSIRQSLWIDLFFRGCSGSTPSPGRRFLFTLPQCPANILAKNFRSHSWLERFAIAGNPSTPESVLERMANEGNQLVRRAAKANLEPLAQVSKGTTSAQTEANQP